jgi:hypothetical protein
LFVVFGNKINRRQLIEQYTNFEHLNQEMVETLIDYISIGKPISGIKSVPPESIGTFNNRIHVTTDFQAHLSRHF